MNAVTQIYEPEAPAFEANRPSMGKVFRRTGWRHVVAWIALLFGSSRLRGSSRRRSPTAT